MIHNLSLVHLFLAIAAGGCVYLALREVRRRHISQWRLFAPASLALVIALELTLIQVGARQPPWTLGAAFLAGMIIGCARGLRIDIQHDMYRPRANVSHAAKLVLLWVAIAVGAAATIEIAGAFASPDFDAARYWAALIGNTCAGAMLARAVVLTVRIHRHA